MKDTPKFRFAIDRGGTFTDIYAKCPSGNVRVMKLLSVDPANYADAPTEGIRRIIEEETGKSPVENKLIDASCIEWIRMGTTVATNALLERKGERMALVTNKGFQDILRIGNQSRPRIFDLVIETPDILYEAVIEVDCRVVPALPNLCCLMQSDKGPFDKWKTVVGTTGQKLLVCQEMDKIKLSKEFKALKKDGIDSIAVVLAHSYDYVDHELQIGKLAKVSGISHVSLSHQVMPMVRMVPRGFTACADAYLTPHIQKYIRGFAAGFKDHLRNVNVLFMQSDGGLTKMNNFNGARAVLSGPAGGVVGYAVTTKGSKMGLPVIGFDMGGTSTDVSRFADDYEHVFETTTAGVTIQAPQLDVNTVAAGGGSMLFFRSGLFVVGPESVGAHPGPVCYRKGGSLALTDANLCLGRLLPEYFPMIFGPTEDECLDKVTTLRALESLTREVNDYIYQKNIPSGTMTVEEVAMGFVRVANETMCRPIRALTQARGYDAAGHVLACFGGAGGQHACSIARTLGMNTVLIHKYAGILSAYGMALADVVCEVQEPCAKEYVLENFAFLDERLSALENDCCKQLSSQGFTAEQIETEAFLHLRYEGTDCALMCNACPVSLQSQMGCKHGNFKQTFLRRYQSEFGFTLPQCKILVDDIRVRGVGKAHEDSEEAIPVAYGPPVADKVVEVYFEGGYQSTSVYLLSTLLGGHSIPGPAIIMDKLSTILVEPDCTAVITATGDVQITIGDGNTSKISTELDPIQLSIFSHRFMSIAEQMGRVLQRASISTNIKERLDFSCALFGPDGGLVSNAPHIPVHLGSMQEAVQFQIRSLGDSISKGDVILSNHPSAGGSHLPDLTVITPVFYKDATEPAFFVASRGHHADIGGITPGSMPAHSKFLSEEGATFKSFFLVKKGVFNEAELVTAFMAPGEIPNSSGTRTLHDNICDLQAQIAANQKGITLVCQLIDAYGLDVVQAYMGYIQSTAEVAVRNMLKEIGRRTSENLGQNFLEAEDFLDDGSVIKVRIILNPEEGSAICDFSGTGCQVWGNCNAPRAITLSALIYCLRCMLGYDTPLNQGCLKPIEVIIPKGSLLDPSEDAAVVGGNVLTSQRIVDVILRAFNVCAASQGCMNNVTFGEADWGYYETVAGGAGAGPTWNGHSAVHTHMTNTRITDLEILELRYPVILNSFSIREGSGGLGLFHGGDGIIRELLFRRCLTLSVLTERRVFSPYGLEGGWSGERGANYLLKNDGCIINLGAKTTITVNPGDMLRMMTPGGGGYGNVNYEECPSSGRPKGRLWWNFLEKDSFSN